MGLLTSVSPKFSRTFTKGVLPVLGIDVPGKRDGAYAVYDAAQDKLLVWGILSFSDRQAERMQYRQLSRLLDYVLKKYQIKLVVIEHPFLYLIAQWIGGIKMWASRRRNLPWYMLTASQARKLVLGSGALRWKMKNGKKINVTKKYVKRRMARRFHIRSLSQHEADAILYAIAGATAYFRQGDSA